MSDSPAPDTAGELDALVELSIAFILFLLIPVAVMTLFADTEELAPRVENGSIIMLSGIIPLLAWARIRPPSPAVALRPGWTLTRYAVFAVVWVPLAMIVYPMVVDALEIEFQAQETVRYYASAEWGARFWLVLLVTCVGAPLAEEVFYRGFLWKAIERVSSPWIALFATSFLFGIMHEASVRVPVGVLGLCFGYLRMKSGGTAAPMFAHMVHNSWTVGAIVAFPQLVDQIYDK